MNNFTIHGSRSTDTTAKLACPICGSYATDVKDSRGNNNSIRRRRKWRKCGERFTTYETIEGLIPSNVFERLKMLRQELELTMARIDKLLDLEVDHD